MFHSRKLFFTSPFAFSEFSCVLEALALVSIDTCMNTDVATRIQKINGAFTHAISTFRLMRFQFLNRKISIHNTMRCVFTLVTNLGLAELALTRHAFSARVNGVSQLGFNAMTNFLCLRFIATTCLCMRVLYCPFKLL